MANKIKHTTKQICRVYNIKVFNKLTVSSLNTRITINTKGENLVNAIVKEGNKDIYGKYD